MYPVKTRRDSGRAGAATRGAQLKPGGGGTVRGRGCDPVPGVSLTARDLRAAIDASDHDKPPRNRRVLYVTVFIVDCLTSYADSEQGINTLISPIVNKLDTPVTDVPIEMLVRMLL